MHIAHVYGLLEMHVYPGWARGACRTYVYPIELCLTDVISMALSLFYFYGTVAILADIGNISHIGLRP